MDSMIAFGLLMPASIRMLAAVWRHSWSLIRLRPAASQPGSLGS
jgi:hypothetical protein